MVLNHRSSPQSAQAVISDIRASGGQAEAIGGDVSQEGDVRAVLAHCRTRHGHLDGLVNNAGILPHAKRFGDTSLDRWNQTFAVNTADIFLRCRGAIRLMAPRHGGTIVSLSSMASVHGGSGAFADYGASRGAVEVMTVGLARAFHLAFAAPSRAAVDAFHAAALAHGATDNGPPGLREHYGPDYYAAFVIDHDGHRIEAVCKTL